MRFGSVCIKERNATLAVPRRNACESLAKIDVLVKPYVQKSILIAFERRKSDCPNLSLSGHKLATMALAAASYISKAVSEIIRLQCDSIPEKKTKRIKTQYKQMTSKFSVSSRVPLCRRTLLYIVPCCGTLALRLNRIV